MNESSNRPHNNRDNGKKPRESSTNSQQQVAASQPASSPPPSVTSTSPTSTTVSAPRPSSTASSMSARREQDNQQPPRHGVSDYTGAPIQASAASHIGDRNHYQGNHVGYNNRAGGFGGTRWAGDNNGQFVRGGGRRYLQGRDRPPRPGGNFQFNAGGGGFPRRTDRPQQPLLSTQPVVGVGQAPYVAYPPGGMLSLPFCSFPVMTQEGHLAYSTAYLNCGCLQCRAVFSAFGVQSFANGPAQPQQLAPQAQTQVIPMNPNMMGTVVNPDVHHQLASQPTYSLTASQDQTNPNQGQAFGQGHPTPSVTPRKQLLQQIPSQQQPQHQPQSPSDSKGGLHTIAQSSVNGLSMSQREPILSMQQMGSMIPPTLQMIPPGQNSYQMVVPYQTFSAPQDSSGHEAQTVRGPPYVFHSTTVNYPANSSNVPLTHNQPSVATSSTHVFPRTY